MYYIIIIAISLFMIAGTNALLVGIGIITEFSILYAILSTIIDFVIMIGIELLVAGIIHALPEKWFSPYNKISRVYTWERPLYEKSGIRKWKNFIPDTGQLCNFKKDELKSTDDDYLYKFLVETCYADVIHFWMAIMGFAILFMNINKPLALLTIDLPMAVISLLLNIPPIIIQRYNRPKLLKVYERNLKKKI